MARFGGIVGLWVCALGIGGFSGGAAAASEFDFSLKVDSESLRARFGAGSAYVGTDALSGGECRLVVARRADWDADVGGAAYAVTPWVTGRDGQVWPTTSFAYAIAADGKPVAIADRGNGACNDSIAMKNARPFAQTSLRDDARSGARVLKRTCGGFGSYVDARAEATFSSKNELIAYDADDWAGILPWVTSPKTRAAVARCRDLRVDLRF